MERSLFMVGWFLLTGQETKWINLLLPHKGKQGEDVWAKQTVGDKNLSKLHFMMQNYTLYIML